MNIWPWFNFAKTNEKKNVVAIFAAESDGLIALRLLGGLGQGTMYAGLTQLLAVWVPLKERTTLATLAYSGSTVN